MVAVGSKVKKKVKLLFAQDWNFWFKLFSFKFFILIWRKQKTGRQCKPNCSFPARMHETNAKSLLNLKPLTHFFCHSDLKKTGILLYIYVVIVDHLDYMMIIIRSGKTERNRLVVENIRRGIISFSVYIHFLLYLL